MKLKLLTWNLAGRNLKKDIDKSLGLSARWFRQETAQGNQVLVAFQECPLGQQELQGILHGHVFSDGRRALVSSVELTSTDEFERSLAATITVNEKQLAVFCYHGLSRHDSAPEVVRGGRASEIRWHVDRYCHGREAVVLGDFNAEPHEPEVQNRWCLAFAGHGECGVKSHGRDRRGFRVVVPRGRGTYFWRRPDGMDPEWKIIDFIAVTDALSKQTNAMILDTTLAGEPLTTAHGYPKLSDHLPVVGEIAL